MTQISGPLVQLFCAVSGQLHSTHIFAWILGFSGFGVIFNILTLIAKNYKPKVGNQKLPQNPKTHKPMAKKL